MKYYICLVALSFVFGSMAHANSEDLLSCTTYYSGAPRGGRTIPELRELSNHAGAFELVVTLNGYNGSSPNVIFVGDVEACTQSANGKFVIMASNNKDQLAEVVLSASSESMFKQRSGDLHKTSVKVYLTKSDQPDYEYSLYCRIPKNCTDK